MGFTRLGGMVNGNSRQPGIAQLKTKAHQQQTMEQLTQDRRARHGRGLPKAVTGKGARQGDPSLHSPGMRNNRGAGVTLPVGCFPRRHESATSPRHEQGTLGRSVCWEAKPATQKPDNLAISRVVYRARMSAGSQTRYSRLPPRRRSPLASTGTATLSSTKSLSASPSGPTRTMYST